MVVTRTIRLADGTVLRVAAEVAAHTGQVTIALESGTPASDALKPGELIALASAENASAPADSEDPGLLRASAPVPRAHMRLRPRVVSAPMHPMFAVLLRPRLEPEIPAGEPDPVSLLPPRDPEAKLPLIGTLGMPYAPERAPQTNSEPLPVPQVPLEPTVVNPLSPQDGPLHPAELVVVVAPPAFEDSYDAAFLLGPILA